MSHHPFRDEFDESELIDEVYSGSVVRAESVLNYSEFMDLMKETDGCQRVTQEMIMRIQESLVIWNKMMEKLYEGHCSLIVSSIREFCESDEEAIMFAREFSSSRTLFSRRVRFDKKDPARCLRKLTDEIGNSKLKRQNRKSYDK